jgi:D-Tyr-tRNAtyr deacylase
LRVFEDDEGKRWAKSVKDKELEILCVSQVNVNMVNDDGSLHVM